MDEMLQFCRTLRQSGRGILFAKFLSHLKGRKPWDTQKSMQDDALVLAAFGSKEGARNFPRVWHRAIATGRTSPKNIRRFATIFGFNSGTDFIRGFEGWLQTQVSSSHFPEFQLGDSGAYIVPIGSELTGDSGNHYLIHNPITGEEYRGQSYKARNTATDNWVFVKTLALDDGMDDEDLENCVANLSAFLDREQSSLRKLKDIKGVAHLLDTGKLDLKTKSGHKSRVPFVVMSFIAGDAFPIAIPAAANTAPRQFAGLENGLLYVEIVRQMLEIVRTVHGLSLRHGDIRPENLMLSSNIVYLVDFAESGMAVQKPPAGEFRLLPSTAPERIRNKEIVLEEAEDIFGIGAVLFWLASGRPYDRPKKREGSGQREQLREYVQLSVNEKLCAFNPGIVHLIAECLHENPGERVAHADDIIQMLDLFERMMGRGESSPGRTASDNLSSLRSAIKELEDNRLFAGMIRRDLSLAVQRANEMVSAHRAEIVGDRHDVIRSLLAFLSILSAGDRYITTTTTDFWLDKNLGANGRFLCANKMLAMHGVRMRRLFILTRDEIKNPSAELVTILRAQAKVVRELKETHQIETEDSSIQGPGYFVGVYPAKDEAEKLGILQEGYHVGIVQTRDQTVSLSFPNDGTGVIRKIYLWNVSNQEFIQRRVRKLQDLFNRALSLTNPKVANIIAD